MRYKAEYEPSFLLDPVTYEFLPFQEVCKPMLDVDDHAMFSERKDTTNTHQQGDKLPPGQILGDRDEDTDSDGAEDEDDEELSRPPPPGFLDPDNLPQDLLVQIYTFENGKPLPLLVSNACTPSVCW